MRSSGVEGCLSPFGMPEQNAIDWASYKQPEFISHSSGGWEAQGQGPTHGAGGGGLVKFYFLVHRRPTSHCVLTW